MRIGWIGGVLAALVMVGSVRAAEEEARLEAFFRAYLDESFQLEPLMATRLGDHRFDDKLDDLSPRARAARVALDRKTLAELTTRFDPKTLTRDARIDLEIFRHSLENSAWRYEHFRPFEDDPRVYGDYLTEGVYLLFAQSTQPKEVNLKNALARMSLVPKVVDAARATLRNPAPGQDRDGHPPDQGGHRILLRRRVHLRRRPEGGRRVGREGQGHRRGPRKPPQVPPG